MSTSLITEYRATQEAIEELQQRLQALSQDQKLQQELEFVQKLRALMAEYGKSLPAIIAILDPQAAKNSRASQPAKASSSRRSRKTKQYKNPNTGEVIETKGGNHKTLKEWKAQYGNDTVENWMTLLD